MYTYFVLQYLLDMTTLWALVSEITRAVLLGFGCGYSSELRESCMGYIVPLTQKWTPPRPPHACLLSDLIRL